MSDADNTRLAREAWEKYGYMDSILSGPWRVPSFQNQIVRDLWQAVRAAAGHPAERAETPPSAPRSYDDVQLTAMKRPCEGCGKVYFWTNATATRCSDCKE